MLEARAQVLAGVRAFFAARDVLEVDTPVLSLGTGTDPHLDPLTTRLGDATYFLQTSPEFHMKRLLAAGAPSIYRLGPAFRSDEQGRLHNPEFTMLEWYRLGFSLQALMDEVAQLVDEVLGPGDYRRCTWEELLGSTVGITPGDDAEQLRAAIADTGVEVSPELGSSVPALLDVAFAAACERLEPGRVFVTEYPPSQAALARTTVLRGREIALRFELLVDGIEIANGYDELRDVEELERRAAAEQHQRREAGQPALSMDARLLAAQRSGLPACAGVALGFDRLLMLREGETDVSRVMAFGAADA